MVFKTSNTNPDSLLHGDKGITMREHFALMAMQAILPEVYGMPTNDKCEINYEEVIAQMSIRQADALIKALNFQKNDACDKAIAAIMKTEGK